MLPAGELAPVSTGERIQNIDILRGLAIWGIVMVNISIFAQPTSADSLTFNTSVVDYFSIGMVSLFFTNKFYSLFSFLFGLGMSIQLVRAEKKGVSFVPLYLRRLFWLLVIGTLHAIFIWNGDILVIYALLGAILLFGFRQASPNTLVKWAIVLIVARALINPIFWHTGYNGDEQTVDREVQTWSEGSYGELTERRWAEWWLGDAMYTAADDPWYLLVLPFSFLAENLDILGLFVLGLAAGKIGVFRRVDDYLVGWRKLYRWGVTIGIAINLISMLLFSVDYEGLVDSTLPFYVGVITLSLGGSILGVGYAAGIVLLSRRVRWIRIFAPVGRMALTNYLFQSLLYSTLFYGYGFGLFGQVSYTALLGLVTGVYGLQIMGSTIWLRYFNYGPVEWVWRSLTYGSIVRRLHVSLET